MSRRLATLLALSLLACGPGKGDDADTTDATDATFTSSPTTDIGLTDVAPTTGDVDPGNPAGFCAPVSFAEGDCPADYVCCSDDPATTQGRIPNYFQNGVIDETHGIPIFSGNNNPLSYFGQCVAIGGFTSQFANGCPVPCNPTWPESTTIEICGTTSTCCQFTQMDPDKDCVLDPQTGQWRAVTGADIPDLTTWGSLHATNQDPDGMSCQTFAGPDGMFDQAAYADCVAQLTVANQRGFCYDPAQCPCVEDVCDQKNPGWVPRCPMP